MHHITVARIRLLEAFASRVRRFAVAVLAAILSLLSIQAVGQVRHHYDQNGRLVGVVAPDGQTTHYLYDAQGNIVSIKKSGSTTTSTADDTNGGSAAPTIRGAGFGSPPAKPAN